MKIEGLKKLTDEASRGGNWRLREICQHPWQINFSGVEYTLATDGKVMAIVRNTTNDFPPMTAEYCKRVLSYLQFPVRGEKMPLDRLKAWAGPAIWLEEQPCGECGGSGFYCKAGNDCECEDDFHEDALKCEDCEATGKQQSMPFRLGRIGKLYFNLNLVAAALETAEGGDILLEVDEHRAIVNGDGWRVWVMAMSQSFKPEKEQEVPTFAVSQT
jgi:hypothetical protein